MNNLKSRRLELGLSQPDVVRVLRLAKKGGVSKICVDDSGKGTSFSVADEVDHFSFVLAVLPSLKPGQTVDLTTMDLEEKHEE